MPSSHVLAVDLGGTKSAWAVVDASGSIIERGREPAWRDYKGAAARVAGLAGGAAGVGVIVPGIYDTESGRAWAPNLWGMDEVPLRAELEDRLGRAITIDSDRSGYVLGEQWLGAARGLRDVVFVAIGTGIGAGILAGGRLIRGAHGIAGAVGWSALTCEWKDSYARTGCWESESAGPALERGAALDQAAEYTAMGVANLISTLNPAMVVLGGGVLQSEFPWTEEIRCRAARWAQPLAFARTRIERTTLGADAGLFGAARLALLACGIHTESEGIDVG
ncbi:MAG: ROK family protein [Acidobacteria bacterium]|nr:ROK family protein [Acidobacteriota bacterium]